MNNEVKLSFWEILFSPFISLSNMVKSKPDIDTNLELNSNSSDKTEAVLAESSKRIDTKVQNYGNSGKAQKRGTIETIKVEQKDLNPKEEGKKTQQKQQKLEQQIGDDGSR